MRRGAAPTFGALAERVGSHAEGGAETFPVAEAGSSGLLGRTLLDGVAASRQLPARHRRRPRAGQADALQDAQLLAGMTGNPKYFCCVGPSGWFQEPQVVLRLLAARSTLGKRRRL